jgi:hypothetical protein
MRWGGTCWAEIEDRAVRPVAYRDLEHARYLHTDAKGNVEIKPWAPNRYKLADLLDALRAVSHLSERVYPPAWIDGTTGPGQVVACRNGLLDVHSRHLYDCSIGRHQKRRRASERPATAPIRDGTHGTHTPVPQQDRQAERTSLAKMAGGPMSKQQGPSGPGFGQPATGTFVTSHGSLGP